MAIEVFIVKSSVSQASFILTQARKSAACKLVRRPKWILYRRRESSSQDGEDMTVCQSWCYIGVIRDLLPCVGGFFTKGLRIQGWEFSAYLRFFLCCTRR